MSKVKRQIKLDETLYQEIKDLPIFDKKTFSEKAEYVLKQYIDSKHKKSSSMSVDPNNITFIDLFAGIGGIRLGFEGDSNNTQCVYSSEWDKFAQQTYQANFGVLPDGDITKVKASSIPDFNVLLAGFPCQPFSVPLFVLNLIDIQRGTLFQRNYKIIIYLKKMMVGHTLLIGIQKV